MMHWTHKSCHQKVCLLGVADAGLVMNLSFVNGNVLTVENNGLAAFFRHESNTSEMTLLGHHKAVVSVSRAVPLLPSRYGTPVSVEILSAGLRDHAALLHERLDRVAGAIEIGFTLHPENYTQILSGTVMTGRNFLKQRIADRAALSARNGLLAGVDDALIAALAISPEQVSYDPTLIRDGVITGSILTQRKGAADTASRLGLLLKQTLGSFCRIEISGPWPAYSFGTREVFT